MKKTWTLSLLLASAVMANAQQSSWFKNETKFQKQFHKHVATMLQMQNNQPQQKTTAIQERLKAQSRYDYSNATAPYMLDSFANKYTGNNGSKFNYDYMNYRLGYALQFNPAYYPYQMEQVDVMADSMKYYTQATATSPINYDGFSIQNFNANNNITKYGEYNVSNGTANGVSMILNTYNAQGKHTQMLVLEDNGNGTLDTMGKFIYYYDAQGRNSIDSIFDYDLGDWTPSATMEYTYDANSNISTIKMNTENNSGTWITIMQYDHTFYPNNKLKTVIGYQDNGNGPQMIVKDSFAYAGNTPFFTTLTEYGYNGSWMPSAMLTKTLNAQNLPDTFSINSYNTTTNQFQAISKIKFSYTTYNNPLQAKQFDNDGMGNYTLMGIANYYYETYNNTNSIKPIAAKANILLYPNPATNTINLQWKESDAKGSTVQVINALGQVMISKYQTTANQIISLPIDMLQTGNYFISVRNNQGLTVYSNQFLKK